MNAVYHCTGSRKRCTTLSLVIKSTERVSSTASYYDPRMILSTRTATGFGSRSCTPIHVQVMNTNSSSTLAVGLVGYIPYIAVPEGYRTQSSYLAAYHHVLQVRLRHYCCPSTSLLFSVYVIMFVRLRQYIYSSTLSAYRHASDMSWMQLKHGQYTDLNVT